jgi:peptidoglycan/LPS O-acetylase OafA/YrhL
VFGARPLVILGQASYSLYLIHQFIGVSIMRLLIGNGLPYIWALPLTIMTIITLAISMFYIVEIPSKAFLLRRTKDWINSPGNSRFAFGPFYRDLETSSMDAK